jgi:hypothetical protein
MIKPLEMIENCLEKMYRDPNIQLPRYKYLERIL